MSEVQGEGKVTVQLSVVGFVLVCVSDEYTALLVNSTVTVSAGTS